jgi:hypothetical protein
VKKECQNVWFVAKKLLATIILALNMVIIFALFIVTKVGPGAQVAVTYLKYEELTAYTPIE